MDVYKTSYVPSQGIASVHMNKRATLNSWPLARHTSTAHIYRYTADQYSFAPHGLVPWWLVLLVECSTVSLAICNSIFHIINSPARCFSTWWDAIHRHIHPPPLSNKPPTYIRAHHRLLCGRESELCLSISSCTWHHSIFVFCNFHILFSDVFT